MFFFPFRVDIPLGRWPFITLLIALICILVFNHQINSDDRLKQALHSFCQQQEYNDDLNIVLSKLKSQRIQSCEGLFLGIHNNNGNKDFIQQLARIAQPIAGFSRSDKQEYISTTLNSNYQILNTDIPDNLSEKLAYKPASFNPVTMITSQFAHADIYHIAGNLLFFFAFAASLEIVLGILSFTAIVFSLSIAVSLAYSFSNLGNAQALATIGLSGVVMGMIGLFTYLMPAAKIRCLFIFLLYFRVFLIPAWILALIYIGSDFYYLFIAQIETSVNLVAHVSGGISGYLIGMIFFKKKKAMISKHIHKINH